MNVIGTRLRFREAVESDALFILTLRLDPAKNQFLSVVEDDLKAQSEWVRAAASDLSQLYFIIEADGRPVGSVRLYDQRGDSFCWGSWVLSHDAPKSSAVESTLMVYALGLSLGFKAAHFDVRKGNMKVWQYHERMGAERNAEDNENFYYVMDEGNIRSFLKRYESRGSIEVVYPDRETGVGNPARQKK